MKLVVATPTRVDVKEGGRVTREVVHHVRAWRKHAGLSVEALAARCGLSGSMISQLERGKTTYTQRNLEAIATALGLQPWQLLACGPEENKDLWIAVANSPELRERLSNCNDAARADLVEMLNNNSDAAVQSWGGQQARREAENAKET
jgi:transcriptional regulator with XRE-family HTH domain